MVKVTARKHGKRGTRYASTEHKCSFTFWPCGRGYASIVLRDGLPAKRSYHCNRGDAVFAAGEWVDPSQNGRYILDNDSKAMGLSVAA